MKYVVILFYKFIDIERTETLKKAQKKLCEELGLKGRMLIAAEGINATFEGTRFQIDQYKKRALEDEEFGFIFKDIVFKESPGNGAAFTRLQVVVRPEVVTLGAGKFDIAKETAPTVTAEELHELYETQDDFVLVDLRNDYEIHVGAFENTIHPNLQNFRELPEKLKALEHVKDKKIITVCTGDIRCEKATCLLKKEGFENVYHLKDGIHDYMQKFPAKHFKGSLFVFDNRLTTPVVDSAEREVIGKCVYCGVASEDFYSDDTVRPSRKLICCPKCVILEEHHLRTCLPHSNEKPKQTA